MNYYEVVNMNKKILSIFLVIAIIILPFILDYLIVTNFKKTPILSLRRKDNLNYVYITPFYRVWKCWDNTIHIDDSNFSCPGPIHNFTIVDETDICAQALELFYNDDKYDYYFTCIKSSTTFVKFDNGQKITVVDALNKGLVSIEELTEAGLNYYRQPR